MSHLTDLQLDVKGCRDIYASFDKYVEVERLEGDNKYHAEKYGLQVKSLHWFLNDGLQSWLDIKFVPLFWATKGRI